MLFNNGFLLAYEKDFKYSNVLGYLKQGKAENCQMIQD